MMPARRIFVDTNILTYATVSLAPFHKEARQKLDELWASGAELYISHQVIREYMVNATRAQTYSPALSMTKVISQVEDFQKSFRILADTTPVLQKYMELAANVVMGGKQLHDANVVAIMLANGITELLTHNTTDFERFRSFITVIPLVVKTTT